MLDPVEVVGARVQAHVLDFGLTKDLRMRQESLTAKDELWGTPAYMAPEQLRAAAPDRRADVYALGATLYFLLSGRAPYDHGHTLGVNAAEVEVWDTTATRGVVLDVDLTTHHWDCPDSSIGQGQG